ncbi:hypothetical protein [Nocardioides montaniterrae]
MSIRKTIAAALATAALFVGTIAPAHAAVRVDRTWSDPARDLTECQSATAAQRAAIDLRGFHVLFRPARSDVVHLSFQIRRLTAGSPEAAWIVHLHDGSQLYVRSAPDGTVTLVNRQASFRGHWTSTPVALAGSAYDVVDMRVRVAVHAADLRKAGVGATFTIVGVSSLYTAEPFCRDRMPRVDVRVATL